jgi:Transposase
MTETATLSKAVGRVPLSSVTNALDLVRQPALALDRLGFVLDINPSAERIFDDDIRLKDRRLYVRDRRASALLDILREELRVTPDFSPILAPTIVVRRRPATEFLLHAELESGPSKDGQMKRARFTEEQIIGVLKEHEAGAKTADLARKHGVSAATL